MPSYAVRKFKNKLFFVLCLICVIVAVTPLVSIIYEVVARGAGMLSIEFLTQGPATAASRGGIGPSIQGTLILIGLTSLVGIPIGVLSGVYLSEYGGNNKYASAMRTINDMLTEFPSIVVGITVSVVFVSIIIGRYSAIAGAAALAFILIPVVARTTEESLKLVPNSVREAALALGVYKWRTTLFVVLPSAKAGLMTGALLAVARVAGETAPLIMTILGSTLFFQGLASPMDALPLRIYKDALMPTANLQAEGWGAALVLIIIVLALNIGVRVASKGRFRR